MDGDRRGATAGAGSRRTRGNGWTRGEFLAAGGAVAIGVVAAASSWSSALAAPPEHAHGGEHAPGPRGFDYRGKRVEIVEDGTGADLTIDGKTVRTKRVGGMHRAPGFAFLPAHTPEELAKGMIDYQVALVRDAAAAGAPGAPVSAGGV